MLAFPILLLLSFWVFRGLVAAALPLLVGGFAIVLTFLLLRLVDQFAGLSIFAVNLVTGMGLGLGIDYSLFVLSRYREELAGGADTRAAIARTLQTAGRTVLYSSLTVAGRAGLDARVPAALPVLDGRGRRDRGAVRGRRLAAGAAGGAGRARSPHQRARARSGCSAARPPARPAKRGRLGTGSRAA